MTHPPLHVKVKVKEEPGQLSQNVSRHLFNIMRNCCIVLLHHHAYLCLNGKQKQCGCLPKQILVVRAPLLLFFVHFVSGMLPQDRLIWLLETSTVDDVVSVQSIRVGMSNTSKIITKTKPIAEEVLIALSLLLKVIFQM